MEIEKIGSRKNGRYETRMEVPSWNAFRIRTNQPRNQRIMKRIALIFALISSPAWATGKPPSAHTPNTTHSASASHATSMAHSAATSTASQTQTATGTATQSQTASGGSASQNQTANGGSATGGTSNATSGDSSAVNEGNTTSYVNQRSAPPIYAPPAFPAVGCGRGVSLGGAGVGGGGIVAFNWEAKDCADIAKRISYAQALSAISRNELACAVLMGHPLAKEVWPAGLPSCDLPSPAVIAPTPSQPPVSVNVTIPESVATKEYVQEVVKRSTAK